MKKISKLISIVVFSVINFACSNPNQEIIQTEQVNIQSNSSYKVIDSKVSKELVSIFDSNKDGKIDYSESKFSLMFEGRSLHTSNGDEIKVDDVIKALSNPLPEDLYYLISNKIMISARVGNTDNKFITEKISKVLLKDSINKSKKVSIVSYDGYDENNNKNLLIATLDEKTLNKILLEQLNTEGGSIIINNNYHQFGKAFSRVRLGNPKLLKKSFESNFESISIKDPSWTFD